MIEHTQYVAFQIRNRLRRKQDAVAAFVVFIAFVAVMIFRLTTPARSAGLDDVTVSLSNETVNTAAQVTVVFTFGTLVDGNTIKIYLGENTGGDEWQLNAVTTADISCSDNGAGEAYTVNSVAAATASIPMWTQITATTVGAGATVVTCLIGDGTPNPMNPISADGYSIAVVTTSDSGAGIAYVGNANDVTVSANVLPNLALTIDNADATNCTTASGVTSCDLGTVTTASVNTGNYDVNVGTNAASGATMTIDEDGNLRNGADEITDLVEDVGGTVTAGVTEYGIAVASDGDWTEQGNFTDDDTPVPSDPTTVATTAAPVAYTNDVTVTHRVAVDSTVKALTYSHIVTWTATANF